MSADPRSIESYGLKTYLDGQSWRHNNNGYDEFVKLLDENKKDPRRVPLSEIGRHFDVDRRTVYNWIETYKKEQESAKRQSKKTS